MTPTCNLNAASFYNNPGTPGFNSELVKSLNSTRDQGLGFFAKLNRALTHDDAIDESSGGEGVCFVGSAVYCCIFDFY